METQNLSTLGHLAKTAGVDFIALQRAAEQVKPALQINSQRYFDQKQAQRLLELSRASAGNVSGK